MCYRFQAEALKTVGGMIYNRGHIPRGVPKEFLLQALAILLKNEVSSGPELCNTYFNLGFIEFQQGELSAAEQHFNAVVAMSEKHMAVSDSNVEKNEFGLAKIHAHRGDFRAS